MKKSLFFSFLVLTMLTIFSCSEKKKSLDMRDSKISKQDSLMSSIKGFWGGETGTPIWYIKRDSIYKFDEEKSYPYLVKGNDVVISYKDGFFIMRNIHVIRDTLFFTPPKSGEIKSFRRPAAIGKFKL